MRFMIHALPGVLNTTDLNHHRLCVQCDKKDTALWYATRNKDGKPSQVKTGTHPSHPHPVTILTSFPPRVM